MRKIFELERHVADLIAAGEVVERPASVVKELVENSIDAGAGIVTVEISDGGMLFVRVTDNGCGIAPGDVKTAFLRHATSKIRAAEGLEAIGTLGFRGEALAAIAAVSRIELTTREPGASEGTRLVLEGGIVRDMSPVGCPEGTSIVVRDLFFNTPARLKFVKSNRAESSAVASVVLRCAVSRPEVSVRFIKDGRTEYHTPGDSRVDSCIYSLFGREFSAGLVYGESADESVSVTGYVSKPDASRGNRSYQFFIVNGRPIQSRVLQAALEQAYANYLPSGRFPSCALYISTKLGDVDVNIHPTKTEVKFVSDKHVFDAVYYAAAAAMPAEGKLSGGIEEPAASAALPAGTGMGMSAKGGELKTTGMKQAGGGFASMGADEFRRRYDPVSSVAGAAPLSVGDSGASQSRAAATATATADSESRFAGYAYDDMRMDAPAGREGFRVVGEGLDTYIIAEHNDSIWLIDKHAAHERIHFNALKSDDYEPMSQSLIEPVICRLGAECASLLLENAVLLDDLGFTAESFGEDSVAVRRIPSEIGIGDTEAVLSGICSHLNTGSFVDSERLDSIFRTIACGSSIKAGRRSSAKELDSLAARVLSGEITHCPHGRPVAFELTKSAIDKHFKRV